MNKGFIRVLSVILVVICIALALPVSTAAADAGTIDVSDVTSDLKNLGIDITKYQKDVKAEHCRLLYFLEYGYDYHGATSDYGIYLYVWNPTGKEIDYNAAGNYIEMRVLHSSGSSTSIRKFALEMCSYSTVQGYEHVFYKFKVKNAVSIYKDLEKGMRQYDIAGIELKHKGDRNATDYKIAGTYSFTGYMPYHDSKKSESNGLNCYVRDNLTVDLKLIPVSWKTNSSDKGAGYQYEVFSVYFSVPNDVIRDYGNKEDPTKGLVEVYGSYEEYKINGVVTPDQYTYDEFEEYVGVLGSAAGLPISFCGNCRCYSGYNLFSAFSFNGPCHFVSESTISRYCSVFYTGGESLGKVSSKEILEFLHTHNKNGYWTMGEVDEGRTRGFQYYTVKSKDENGNRIDLNEQIATYASNHNAFVAWLRGDSKYHDSNESYDAIEAIEVISESEFYKDGVLLTDAGIAKKYFLQESEVPDLKKYVASAALKNETTYMLRFAVRDYYSTEINVHIGQEDLDRRYFGNYYFEKTIFDDFDVLSLTYENSYGQKTVIPVSCSPIDIVGTITPPSNGNNTNVENPTDDTKGDNDYRWIWILLTVIVVLLVLNWILNLFGFNLADLFRGLVKLITAPFRWVSKLFSKRKSKNKKKDSKKDKSSKAESKPEKTNEKEKEKS